MKKISVIMIAGFMLSLLNARVFAQNKSELNTTIIEPYRLPITFHKTTNLVFPYAIKSVDRGSKDILAQKAKGVDNVLQIKAGKLGFEQTNLTVITADGKLYSYLLDYSDTPTVLNISFTNNPETKSETFFLNPIVNEAQMQAEAEMVINEERNINGIKDKSFGIKLLMDGLFINDDVLYCRLKLQNNSNINYGIEQFRFYIRDQKKSKRTATQEIEVTPLHINGDTSVVPGQTEKVLVFALPKFTIPDKKYFAIELMEKSGGRHLHLQVHNRTILRAKSLK